MPRLPEVFRPSWKVRRRIVIITLVWCGAMVSYLAVWGRDIDLSETIANGALLLMASVIGSYVFGAVWDDKNQTQAAVDVQTGGTPDVAVTVDASGNAGPTKAGGVE